MNVLRRFAAWLGLGHKEPSPDDVFTTLRRPGGGVTLVDTATLNYLASNAPPPSQASLDAALEQATRVRVYRSGVADGQLLSDGPALLDTDDLARVREALRIESSPGGHCMCHGDHGMEFLDAAEQTLALLGLHHGYTIRWNAWKDDAVLADGRALLEWLAERGLPGPLASYEDEQREHAAQQARAEAWEAATPECLRGMQDTREGLDYPGSHEHEHDAFAALEAVLAEAYPDEDQRIRVLFEWYGSSGGPWSGYPSYEAEAESFLLRYPTPPLIRGVESAAHPSPQLLEGAARLFGSWSFRKNRAQDEALLPDALKRRLLDHVLPTNDEDKAARANAAFSA